jgi:hypothetical protein
MTTGPAGPLSSGPAQYLSIAVELAFFRDALERLAGALDTILVLVAFERQQFYDFEQAARTKAAERASGVTHILADRILVGLQQRTPPVLNTPTAFAPHDGTHFLNECPFDKLYQVLRAEGEKTFGVWRPYAPAVSV